MNPTTSNWYVPSPTYATKKAVPTDGLERSGNYMGHQLMTNGRPYQNGQLSCKYNRSQVNIGIQALSAHTHLARKRQERLGARRLYLTVGNTLQNRTPWLMHMRAVVKSTRMRRLDDFGE